MSAWGEAEPSRDELVCAGALTLLVFGATGCFEPAPTTVVLIARSASNGPQVPVTAAPGTEDDAAILVVAPEEAERLGLEGRTIRVAFGGETSGTALLRRVFREGREHGALRVADVGFYFATSVSGHPGECRVGIEARGLTARFKPPTPPIAPPLRETTPSQPETRAVLGTASRCGDRPVLKMQSEQVCRVDSQGHLQCHMEYPVRSVSEWQCQNEPVVHYEVAPQHVARYPFENASKHALPELLLLKWQSLEESTPVCYRLPDSVAPQGDRLEMQLFYRR